MSLNGIVQSSSASLRAIQIAIQGRSDNINNAQNEDFTRRDVSFVSPGGSLVDATVTRALDGGLRQSYYQLNSQSAAAGIGESVLKQLGDLMGTTQGSSTLQQRVSAFTTAWQGFESDPASSAAESLIVQNGDALATEMRQTAASLNHLEETLNAQATDQVKELNTNLSTLADLNQTLSGDPNAASLDPGLLDKRDQLLKAISTQVAINPIYQTDGSVQLYATTGTLLAGQEAQQFQWNTGSAPYAQPDVPPSISIVGAAVANSVDLRGGQLGAYLDVLNSSSATNATGNPQVGAIEKLRDQLDGLAGLLTKPSPGTAYTTGGLSDVYAAAASDRSTDLAGGPVVTPDSTGTSENSLFTSDNTLPTAPAVWVPRADTIQFNGNLLSGSATLKRPAASAVVALLSSSSFSLSTGGVTVSGRTLEGIASAMALYHSNAQASASDTVTRLDSASQSLKDRLSSKIGVNMDEEVAQLTVLQNAYSASAKVITTVQTMFDTLLNLKS